MNPATEALARGPSRGPAAGPGPGAASPPRERSPLLPLGLIGVFLAFLVLPRVHANPRIVWAFVSVGGVLAAWTAVLWARAARGGHAFRIERVPLVKSHYVQACVHSSIYAYWGWYWRPVYAEIPLIASQIVFLFVLDALLSWSRGRPWRPGFGPLPIIFSTNLFIWFKDDWFVFQFLMVATGAFGKEFIRWKRGDRSVHIFNPSAFGLALFSMVLIATKTTHYTWGIEIAGTLAYPPHIYLEIFLLGLVVQYFFAVTLMTLSATAALLLLNYAYFQIYGVYQFVDTNIPIAVFLGLHLLVTDPATSPRSSLGRVIFGALYGLGNFVLFTWFFHLDIPEFYDKLLPVPILNLMVRVIDRFTAKGVLGSYARWESRFSPRTVNLAAMSCWAALFLSLLATRQVDAPHPGASIDFWREAYREGRANAGGKLFKVASAQAQVLPQGAAAANQVGVLYIEGDVVEQSRPAAGHYFATACAAGDLDGCANVATQFLFLREARSDRDRDRALAALEQACAQGRDAASCYLIGFAYETGSGRPGDLARARQIYEEGCRRGDPDACKALVRTAGSEGRGSEGAALVLERECERGDAEACLYLASMRHRGAGIARDETLAKDLLRRACDLGSKPACDAIAAGVATPASMPRPTEAPRWRGSSRPAR